MNCIVTYVKFLNQYNAGGPIIDEWVEKIDTYMKTGPWDPDSVDNEVNQFLQILEKVTGNFPALQGNIFGK